MIEVSVTSQLRELDNLTSQLSARQIAIATSRAINRSLVHGKAKTKTFIKQEFNIKNSDLRLMIVKNSSTSKLSGNLTVDRRPISLTHFNPVFYANSGTGISKITVKKFGKAYNKSSKSTRRSGAKGVSFEVFKGKSVNIPYAFITNNNKQNPVFARGKYVGSGDSYAFVRRTKRSVSTGSDLPITKLSTTSIYGAMQHKEVNKNIDTTVMDYFSKRAVSEMKNLINRL